MLGRRGCRGVHRVVEGFEAVDGDSLRALSMPGGVGLNEVHDLVNPAADSPRSCPVGSQLAGLAWAQAWREQPYRIAYGKRLAVVVVATAAPGDGVSDVLPGPCMGSLDSVPQRLHVVRVGAVLLSSWFRVTVDMIQGQSCFLAK